MFTFTKRPLRIAAVMLAAGAAGGGLAACGSTGASSSPSQGIISMPPSAPASQSADAVHNAQDVTFAQLMIPHHEQAIAMAQMVPSYSQDKELIALAAKIQDAQLPEIGQMQSWLSEWGASSSPSSSGGHQMPDGSTMGGTSPMGEGMMTDEQMMQLQNARAQAFATMWLQMMIKHHQGAVVMAQAELAGGQNPQAKALAQAIIDGQNKEITQMKAMLVG